MPRSSKLPWGLSAAVPEVPVYIPEALVLAHRKNPRIREQGWVMCPWVPCGAGVGLYLPVYLFAHPAEDR